MPWKEIGNNTQPSNAATLGKIGESGNKLMFNGTAVDTPHNNLLALNKIGESNNQLTFNGTVVGGSNQAAPVATSRSGFVNVRDSFGAKGDGVTDDSVALQAALDDPNSSLIEIPKGTYMISRTLKVPSNKTLHIASGATIKQMDTFVLTTYFVYNGTGSNANGIALITNADHVNGNEYINITGGGKIVGNSLADYSLSWQGIWFDKCKYCTVSGDGLEVSNIGMNITWDNGGIRSHCVTLSYCDNCTIEGVVAHTSGDDNIRVGAGSRNCTVQHCIAWGSMFGHCYQAVGKGPLDHCWTMADRHCEGTKFLNLYGRDTGQQWWGSAGVAIHSARYSLISDCFFERVGSGVLLLGEFSSGSVVQNIWMNDIGTNGVEIVATGLTYPNDPATVMENYKVSNIHLYTTNPYNFCAVDVSSDGCEIRNVKIENVTSYNQTGGSIVSFEGRSKGLRRVSVSGVTSETQGIDLYYIEEASITNNVVRDISIRGSKKCIITGNRSNMGEDETADYNLITGNVTRGSSIQKLGANSIVTNNIFNAT